MYCWLTVDWPAPSRTKCFFNPPRQTLYRTSLLSNTETAYEATDGFLKLFLTCDNCSHISVDE